MGPCANIRTKKDRCKGWPSLGRKHNVVQQCAIREKRQWCVSSQFIYCLTVRISCGWHVFRHPTAYIYWGVCNG